MSSGAQVHEDCGRPALYIGHGCPEAIKFCGVNVILVFNCNIQEVSICLECQVINPVDVGSVLKLLG